MTIKITHSVNERYRQLLGERETLCTVIPPKDFTTNSAEIDKIIFEHWCDFVATGPDNYKKFGDFLAEHGFTLVGGDEVTIDL